MLHEQCTSLRLWPGSSLNWHDQELTCAWPAISIPASRNSSKSSLNFPEAAASSPLWPRVAWTTSPADWFRSAAAWFSSLWASWNDLELGGSCKRQSSIFYCQSHHTTLPSLESSTHAENTKRNGAGSWIMGQLSTKNLFINLCPAFSFKDKQVCKLFKGHKNWQLFRITLNSLEYQFGKKNPWFYQKALHKHIKTQFLLHSQDSNDGCRKKRLFK